MREREIKELPQITLIKLQSQCLLMKVNWHEWSHILRTQPFHFTLTNMCYWNTYTLIRNKAKEDNFKSRQGHKVIDMVSYKRVLFKK